MMLARLVADFAVPMEALCVIRDSAEGDNGQFSSLRTQRTGNQAPGGEWDSKTD
jgi:hypothetical protein